MTLMEALQAVQEAAGHWNEYLDDNGREAECEVVDAANDVLDEFARLLSRLS